MTARWIILVCVLLLRSLVVAAQPGPVTLRIDPFASPMPGDMPGWLVAAIREALQHDLSRLRGIEFRDVGDARLVVRGTVQSVNGSVRVDLTVLDDGRSVGVVRVTEPTERLFTLQDAVGEQARVIVERVLRRRSEDVAPDPREVTIHYVGPVSVAPSVVRPSFLPPSPTSLEGSRLRRNHTYEYPTNGSGCGWWYARPGWYGWPGSCRWLW